MAVAPDVPADGPEAAHPVAAVPLAVFAATCSGGSAQVGGRIAASQMDSLLNGASVAAVLPGGEGPALDQS